MGVGHIASDEERLVLSQSVVQFSFTYGVLYIMVFFKLKKKIILKLTRGAPDIGNEVCSEPLYAERV